MSGSGPLAGFDSGDATFAGASADGTRVFFTTSQKLMRPC
jgi:hypothetical protein